MMSKLTKNKYVLYVIILIFVKFCYYGNPFQSVTHILESYDYNRKIINELSDYPSTRIPAKNSSEYWAFDQALRRNLLSQECLRMEQTQKLNPGNAMRNIYIDKKHKVLYCYIPKVASTQWKRIMMVLTGTAPKGIVGPENITGVIANYRNGLKSLNDMEYKKDDLEITLKTYRKMIIVRHPMERLFSAYKNKFVAKSKDADNFRRIYAPKMMAFARNLDKNKVPKNGTGMTFREFLFYLSKHNPTVFQKHWRPMHDICSPCNIKYDFIGKFESIERDSNEILARINSSLKFPKYISSSTPDALKKEIVSIPTDLIDQIYNSYQPDYTLFGYDRVY